VEGEEIRLVGKSGERKRTIREEGKDNWTVIT